MKNDQTTHAAEDLEVRALTTAEVLAVAGGPQVLNDMLVVAEIRELSGDEVLAVAGGPQVMNDSH